MVNTAIKNMNTIQADLAFFTPAVKPTLHRLGSSEDYTRTQGGSVKTQLGPKETAFIAGRESFYLAAIGEDRWPYTQRHRGPKGFLRVLDGTIVGFASIATNRRYVSPGDALLFLIDHTLQARLKIWADAEVSEDPAILEELPRTRGHSWTRDLAFLFRVRAFGWCNEQHTSKRSTREVHNTEAARPGKSDFLSTNAITAKRCLSLDASSGGWTLNAHSWSPP
jgi:uncharacterized protein